MDAPVWLRSKQQLLAHSFFNNGFRSSISELCFLEREGEERKEEKKSEETLCLFFEVLANTPLLVARLRGLCRTSWMVVELNEKQRQKHRR